VKEAGAGKGVEVEEGVEAEVKKGTLEINKSTPRRAIGTRRKVMMISVSFSLITITWKRFSSSKANHIRLQCVPIFKEVTVSKEKDALLLIIRLNSTNTNKANSVLPPK